MCCLIFYLRSRLRKYLFNKNEAERSEVFNKKEKRKNGFLIKKEEIGMKKKKFLPKGGNFF